MNITTVIEHLRAHCPGFGGRVAGAARYKQIDETASMSSPAAFVIPLDDSPGERMSLNDVRQTLTESFAVVVSLDNRPDERGQNAVNAAHDTIRAQLWAALLGWQPDGLAENSIYRGIDYQGGNLLHLDRARLWFQFDFSAEREIGPADGYQATELNDLPHFDGATINVDDIDPAADPNLSYPGPDGRIEHIIHSPKTGNLP